jgi:peptidoglycan/xylan/chitin deacetylase (PgdA/CDA1 family)
MVTFDDGFASLMENALPELVRFKVPAVIFVTTGCLGLRQRWINDIKHKDYKEHLLTVDQLQKLNNNVLITIGSHCVTHASLLKLSNEDAQKEIIDSKKYLESVLQQHTIEYLSFPYGAFTDEHVAMAKSGGYKKVFSTLPNRVLEGRDEYVIGRVRVSPMDWPVEFRLKLHGAYRWLPAAITAKKKMRTILQGKRCTYN